MAVGIRHADHVVLSIRKIDTNFSDKRRSLCRYSSLAEATELLFRYKCNKKYIVLSKCL
jgi:hypothetical protein